jgi:sulfane dehydrogenase subunit SoxC
MDSADPPDTDPAGNERWRPPHKMEPDKTFRARVAIDQLQSRITPSQDVFVLAHFGIPRIDANEWRLHFSGMLSTPRAMTLDDLKAFPRHDIESFIKCAGIPSDHRIATRNVSNAVWAGARLVDVMQSVGIASRATHLWFTAPDHGTYRDWSADQYVKDMPVSRVNVGDVLLAYEMNGDPLTAEHGFPVRVFVPGFYGANSVKWVSRIEAADHRAPGIFNNELYNDPVFDENGTPSGRTAPVWGVAPEALIVQPAAGAKLAAGAATVSGWCWGEHPVDRVELSCDDGLTWISTSPGARYQNSWQSYSFDIHVETRGALRLQVRATDTKGETQPLADARNSVHEIRVSVV